MARWRWKRAEDSRRSQGVRKCDYQGAKARSEWLEDRECGYKEGLVLIGFSAAG